MLGKCHTFAISINDRRAGTVPGNTQIKKVMKNDIVKFHIFGTEKEINNVISFAAENLKTTLIPFGGMYVCPFEIWKQLHYRFFCYNVMGAYPIF